MQTQDTNTNNAPEQVADRPFFRPPVDIYENQDGLLLVVDLPGVPNDAIKIELDKDTLTIVGRRPLPMPEGARVLAGPASAWDYRRQFTVPSQVDPDRIKADLKNGVLEVHLPRHERSKPRRIAIG